jgi:hypothetical protein
LRATAAARKVPRLNEPTKGIPVQPEQIVDPSVPPSAETPVRGVRRWQVAFRESRSAKVFNTLVLRGFGSGLAVLITLLVTRYLPTSDAAAFLLLFNLTTVATVCFRWGLDDVILRREAANTAAKAPAISHFLMWLAHRRVMIWMTLGAAATAAFGLARPQGFSGLNSAELFTAVAISGLVALTASAGRVHQGQGRTNYAAFLLNILVPGCLLLGLLLLVRFGPAVNSSKLQLVYAGVSLATYLAVVWGTSPTRPSRLRSAEERAIQTAQAKVDLSAANRLGGVVLSQQALNWIALLIVPIAYGDRLFTSFMVTYKAALLISLVMLAVNFTFASRLATLFAAGEFHELQRLVRIMVVSVAAASGFAAGLVFVARGYLYSFAGVDSADHVLALLVVSQAFFALSSVYALVLTMCHDEAFLLKAQGGIVISGVIVFATLSFTAPLEVSSAAFVVTYLALTLVLRQRVRRVIRGR